MNFANFGIAVGALGQGVMQGLQIGRAIRQARDENEIRDLTQEGMDAAQRVRQQGIDASIMSTPGLAVSDEGVAGTPQQFSVGGKPFTTRDEATKAAEAQAPEMMSIYRKQFAPKVYAAYIQQGKPEKAEDFRRWIETSEAQEGLNLWATTMRAAQRGDWEAAGDGYFKMAGMAMSDITPLTHRAVKDASGNITGFDVRWRDNKTGEEKAQSIDVDMLLDQGPALFSPHQYYEAMVSRRSEQQKFRRELLLEDAKAKRSLENQVAMAGIGAQYDMQRDVARTEREVGSAGRIASAKTLAEANAVALFLKGRGMPDAEINRIAPFIVGVKDGSAVSAKDVLAARFAIGESMDSSMSAADMATDAATKQKRIDEIMDGIIPGWRAVLRQTSHNTELTPSAGETATTSRKGLDLYDPATGIIYPWR